MMKRAGREMDVGQLLKDRGLTLSVAESCTGGMLGAILTAEPGASAFFLGGVIAYANDVKVGNLEVPAEVIEKEGAVSASTARHMALGVRARFGSDYAISVTGIAGPDGGADAKPVGLVFIAVTDGGRTSVRECRFKGGRAKIRQAACDEAVAMLMQALDGNRAE